MKNILMGILASVLFTSAAFAHGAKKTHAKKHANTTKCDPATCPSTASCHQANCVNMPGCVCK